MRPAGLAVLGCLMAAALLAAAVRPAAAQGAAQVLAAGQWNRTVSLARVASGLSDADPSGSAASSEPQFYQPGVKLPSCPQTALLAGDAGVPDNWAELPALEQATHPVNALIMQLAYASWQDNAEERMGPCLSAMGISSMQMIHAKVTPYGGTMTALVMRAGSRGVFVAFRGTDFEDPGDVLVDADCHQTSNLRQRFSTDSKGNIRLHTGFYSAWLAVEKEVLAAVDRELAQVDAGKRVYFVGHSLGAAMAAVAALQTHTTWTAQVAATAVADAAAGAGANASDAVSDAASVATDAAAGPAAAAAAAVPRVAGVWLYGCPRVGNDGWAAEYSRQLQSRTLRIATFKDFASRLPMRTQLCPLTHGLNATFGFSHIGRSLVMCPDRINGLVDWRLEPAGSERLDCGWGIDLPDLTIKTHWLGSYLDAWRRGRAQLTSVGGDGPHMANVLCEQCGDFFVNQNKQTNQPTRKGGPVMCFSSVSCNTPTAWNAATSIGPVWTKIFLPLSTCIDFMCT